MSLRLWWPASTTLGWIWIVVLVEIRRHRELIDVEAELVEPADPLVDAPAVAPLEALDTGQLGPEFAIARDDRLGDRDRVGALLEHAPPRGP